MAQKTEAKPRRTLAGTVTTVNAYGIKLSGDPVADWLNYSQYAPILDEFKPALGDSVTVTYTESDSGKRFIQHVQIGGAAHPQPAATAPPRRQSAPPPPDDAPLPDPPRGEYGGRDALIVRQVALKCAVEFFDGERDVSLDAVLEAAETMYRWVLSGEQQRAARAA